MTRIGVAEVARMTGLRPRTVQARARAAQIPGLAKLGKEAKRASLLQRN
jgi:hypothetical protein